MGRLEEMARTLGANVGESKAAPIRAMMFRSACHKFHARRADPSSRGPATPWRAS